MRKLDAALVAPALAGRGYRASFDLPPHIHTLSVATSTNKTLERNLDFEFRVVSLAFERWPTRAMEATARGG